MKSQAEQDHEALLLARERADLDAVDDDAWQGRCDEVDLKADLMKRVCVRTTRRVVGDVFSHSIVRRDHASLPEEGE